MTLRILFRFLLKVYLFIYFIFWLWWIFVALCRLLVAVASLVVEHRLQASVVAHRLESSGSVVMHGLRCSKACGILLDRGLNWCPLHFKADSQPLNHQGSPEDSLILIIAYTLRSPSDMPASVLSICVSFR